LVDPKTERISDAGTMPSHTPPIPSIERSDAERFGRALRFAAQHHGQQARKGTTTPYVSHLLHVAGLVLEHGGSIDQAIAGLLHDVIEDCGVAAEKIASEFGESVAEIVRGCTDLLEGDTPDRKSDWQTRKERYIAHLTTAADTTVLVSACDKVHNLATLVDDLRSHGRAYLDRFTGSPPQQVWYYRAIRAAVGMRIPQPLAARLDALLEEFAVLVEAH
jgi:GTP pyrophosphokinase